MVASDCRRRRRCCRCHGYHGQRGTAALWCGTPLTKSSARSCACHRARALKTEVGLSFRRLALLRITSERSKQARNEGRKEGGRERTSEPARRASYGGRNGCGRGGGGGTSPGRLKLVRCEWSASSRDPVFGGASRSVARAAGRPPGRPRKPSEEPTQPRACPAHKQRSYSRGKAAASSLLV